MTLPLDLHQTPYSCRGSYLALSHLNENHQGLGNAEGLHLRTIHNCTITPLIARLDLQWNGTSSKYTALLEDASLALQCGDARVEACFADDRTLLLSGTPGCGLTLDFLTDNGPYDYIYPLLHEGRTLYMANCYKNNCQYLIIPQKGQCELDQQWEESSSLWSRLHFSGEDGFLFALLEVETEWDQQLPCLDFDAARQRMNDAFRAFCDALPTLPENYSEMRIRAAYIDWSCLVRPGGFLRRDGMLMSKNWMTNVWSWDHCFNALAMAKGHPDLAWDAYIIMADHQDTSGRLPDSISDQHVIWNYCKPPIHGWALLRLMESMTLTPTQLEEAYQFLTRWTKWWMTYRRRNGLYYYNHGNDSGWDNSTAFSLLPPVATPELQAFMIVQMEVLSDLARQLHSGDDAQHWQAEASAHLDVFLKRCFRNDLPVAIQLSTGQIVENESLLPYEILVLGDRLPETVRKKVIGLVSSEKFLTAHGFATESPTSPFYRDDGYWRGPIWAPSTMLMLDGLEKCGETALVKEVARRFVDMTAVSGFAENFNALTGKGLRDLAYTWTASVALVLARDYLN
ncbi:MAG: glycogen debranching protein [Clostridiales bacterium]|nr:glycogen debranching protein [Clostridiales bacterium]